MFGLGRARFGTQHAALLVFSKELERRPGGGWNVFSDYLWLWIQLPWVLLLPPAARLHRPQALLLRKDGKFPQLPPWKWLLCLIQNENSIKAGTQLGEWQEKQSPARVNFYGNALWIVFPWKGNLLADGGCIAWRRVCCTTPWICQGL